MTECKCGGPIEKGDPNGIVCTNTGLYVHACTAVVVEIRAEITLVEPDLEDLDPPAIDVSQEAAECDTY